MDADSYLNHFDMDVRKYQDLSVQELTRDQQGKTNFYENLKKMQEQVVDIKLILDNMMADKQELDYGLKPRLDDIKINTLKYITEHLLDRINTMELLRDQGHN